jgi:ligand-binding sensor domain-containing protein/two-component sensor histidine kinase
MPTHARVRRSAPLALLLASALAMETLSGAARAQTYPFRRYDVPEGLPNGRVDCVFQDSRGYLWFGTWEGLSRFDGVEFKNYSTKEGLPSFLVNAVAEDAKGAIWVATQGGGVARLVDDPAARTSRTSSTGGSPRSMFEVHRIASSRESNIVTGLLIDGRGDLWCGCESGIYRASLGSAPNLAFERITEGPVSDSNQFALVDERGRVWAGTQDGIVVIEGSKIVARIKPPEPQADLRPLYALIPHPKGGALAVYARDLFEIASSPEPGAAPVWSRLPISFSPLQEARRAFFAADGTLWIGTTSGLVRWRNGVETTLTTDNGLPDASVRCFCEDKDHDLWLGTWSSGVAKLASEAFLNFVLPDVMPDRNALYVFQAQDGAIYVTGKSGIARLSGNHLELVPGSLDPQFAAVAARILQDRRGDFWVGSDHGVHLCPGPELDLLRRRRIADIEVFGMFLEDEGGRIWFGSLDGFLYGWDPAASPTPQFERTAIHGPTSMEAPRALHVDAAGELWLAPYVGLARLVGGKVEPMETSEGLPDLQTRCFFEDRRGRLWIGTRFQGVSVTDEPTAAHPRFRNYSTRTGLASDAVWSIAEDEAGRMYLGTSRGIERLDVDEGRVTHLTSFDGLAGDIVNTLMEDRDGNIWAATSGGLSRFDPRAEPSPPAPPPIYLSRIAVAGEDLPIPETGAILAPAATLPSSKDNVLIEFVGLSFRDERDVAYQYRLEGVDGDWSPPAPQRSVNYAHLAPGDYRFLVRGVHASGAASTVPASFSFRVLHPTWQQPWFLAILAVLCGGIVYLLHRSRVRRILALEAIRTQIATDIHDDMGSGLAQIAILTEVVKRETPPAAGKHLDEVLRLARTMRDSMSDIVWAVDPRRDRFADLVQRMRQAAFNLLGAEGLQVEFRAPEDGAIEDVGLAPDRRRHLLLVLKEALSNVARHARASRVEIEIRIEGGRLQLSIRDDGRGFDPAVPAPGHGLSSLRRRAQQLSGTIRIESAPNSGTRIEVEIPA